MYFHQNNQNVHHHPIYTMYHVQIFRKFFLSLEVIHAIKESSRYGIHTIHAFFFPLLFSQYVYSKSLIAPFSINMVLIKQTVRVQTGEKYGIPTYNDNTKRHEWMSSGNVWDDIVPDRELPGNVKYMVVDLETHDWMQHTAQSKYDTGRIVKIAWNLLSDTGDCLESKQYLIKPYGTYNEIAPKATEVHGITNALMLSWFWMNSFVSLRIPPRMVL